MQESFTSSRLAAEERIKSLSPEPERPEKEFSPEQAIKEAIARAKLSKSPSSKETTPSKEESPFTMKLRKAETKKRGPDEEQKITFQLKKPPEFKRALQPVGGALLLRIRA